MEWIPTTVSVQLAGLEHVVRRTSMIVKKSLVNMVQHAKLSSYLYRNSTVNYLCVITQDLVNDFHCNCLNGYTGEYCETNIDDCESNPCGQHGFCTDQVGGYFCSCNNDFNVC